MSTPPTPGFDPAPILAVLQRHQVDDVVVGGYAATLHGAQRPTSDVDITPSTTTENLQRVAAALSELQARVRTATEPNGLPFAASAESLRGVVTLNLQTPIGELDLAFSPAGTDGYPDLGRSATTHQVASVQVRVAALGDVIRSKESCRAPQGRRCTTRAVRAGGPLGADGLVPDVTGLPRRPATTTHASRAHRRGTAHSPSGTTRPTAAGRSPRSVRALTCSRQRRAERSTAGQPRLR